MDRLKDRLSDAFLLTRMKYQKHIAPSNMNVSGTIDRSGIKASSPHRLTSKFHGWTDVVGYLNDTDDSCEERSANEGPRGSYGTIFDEYAKCQMALVRALPQNRRLRQSRRVHLDVPTWPDWCFSAFCDLLFHT